MMDLDHIRYALNYIRNVYGNVHEPDDYYGLTSADASRSSDGGLRPEYLGWRP